MNTESETYPTEDAVLSDLSMAPRKVEFFMSSVLLGAILGSGQRRLKYGETPPTTLKKVLESRGAKVRIEMLRRPARPVRGITFEGPVAALLGTIKVFLKIMKAPEMARTGEFLEVAVPELRSTEPGLTVNRRLGRALVDIETVNALSLVRASISITLRY